MQSGLCRPCQVCTADGLPALASLWSRIFNIRVAASETRSKSHETGSIYVDVPTRASIWDMSLTFLSQQSFGYRPRAKRSRSNTRAGLVGYLFETAHKAIAPMWAHSRRGHGVAQGWASKASCRSARTRPTAAADRPIGSSQRTRLARRWRSPRRGLGTVTDLLLRKAQAGRAGAQGDDDYDVIGADGLVIGRIFKATSLVGTPWMWTLAYGEHEDRTPTHGYEATREAAMQAFARSWHRET